jgi:hypothetical protein
MTATDFRRLLLDLEGVEERAHMGHPDFRLNGRIFASLHTQDRFGMVKLSPEEQREVMRGAPGVFSPSSGAWGRQGCTNVLLAAATPAVVRGAVILAWQAAAARPPSRARSSGALAKPRRSPGAGGPRARRRPRTAR